MVLFKKYGWFYFPIHPIGWALSVTLAGSEIAFGAISMQQTTSVLDAMWRFLPYFVSLAAIFFFIAINTVRNKKINNDERNNNAPKHLRYKNRIDSYGGTLFVLGGYIISSWIW